MRKPITGNTFTQINTNDSDFLVQNISVTKRNKVAIIVGTTTPPEDTDLYDFILDFMDGLSQKDVIGIIWAKALDERGIRAVDSTGIMGVVEG